MNYLSKWLSDTGNTYKSITFFILEAGILPSLLWSWSIMAPLTFFQFSVIFSRNISSIWKLSNKIVEKQIMHPYLSVYPISENHGYDQQTSHLYHFCKWYPWILTMTSENAIICLLQFLPGLFKNYPILSGNNKFAL